jgi:hypothetical protein
LAFEASRLDNEYIALEIIEYSLRGIADEHALYSGSRDGAHNNNRAANLLSNAGYGLKRRLLNKMPSSMRYMRWFQCTLELFLSLRGSGFLDFCDNLNAGGKAGPNIERQRQISVHGMQGSVQSSLDICTVAQNCLIELRWLGEGVRGIDSREHNWAAIGV